MTRANLATLLNTNDVPTAAEDTHKVLDILRRLTMNAIINVSDLIRIDPPTIARILWKHRYVPPRHVIDDPQDLVALLLRHHPTPVTVAHAVTALGYNDRHIHAMIAHLDQSPPRGIRLFTDGTLLALQPDPILYEEDDALGDSTSEQPPSAQPPPPHLEAPESAAPPADLDYDTVRALRLLLTTPSVIPPDVVVSTHQLDRLRTAGILTDDQPPHISADTRYSLQWWHTADPSYTSLTGDTDPHADLP